MQFSMSNMRRAAGRLMGAGIVVGMVFIGSTLVSEAVTAQAAVRPAGNSAVTMSIPSGATHMVQPAINGSAVCGLADCSISTTPGQ